MSVLVGLAGFALGGWLVGRWPCLMFGLAAGLFLVATCAAVWHDRPIDFVLFAMYAIVFGALALTAYDGSRPAHAPDAPREP